MLLESLTISFLKPGVLIYIHFLNFFWRICRIYKTWFFTFIFSYKKLPWSDFIPKTYNKFKLNFFPDCCSKVFVKMNNRNHLKLPESPHSHINALLVCVCICLELQLYLAHIRAYKHMSWFSFIHFHRMHTDFIVDASQTLTLPWK